MPRRILLIDDNRLQYRLTQAHFQNFRGERFDLDWASTYEDGLLRLAKDGEYAACLLDYQLGPRDGLQLIREAVGKGCTTPIIFLTAESSAAVDIEAMNAGAFDYLVKGELTPPSLERSLRYSLKLGDTLEELRRLATRDELTSLLNRREFDRILAQEQERARRFGHALALVMVDIDHFKSVNDRYGHQVGDVVLREVATRIKAQIRNVDFAARLGGEEFGIILIQSDGPGAEIFAERMRHAVQASPVPTQTIGVPVTISLGVAALPIDASNATELVAAADRALYAAKGAGRNRVVRAGS